MESGQKMARFTVLSGFAAALVCCSLSEASEKVESGGKLLQKVRRVLPSKPLALRGELRVIRKKGVATRSHPVRILIDFAGSRGSARYTIQDPRNGEVEKLRVNYFSDKASEYFYGKGVGEPDSELSNLYGAIQDTSISWLDLTLSFLWWREEKTVGMDAVKGRECYIVVVRPPSSAEKTVLEEPAEDQYSKVKLWIDAKVHMVLQAEGYDHDDKLVRRLTIRSLKKIKDHWMIKEMEIESRPFTYRTRLRINDMRVKKDYEPVFED